jgi:threonine/homoserine/homoserine lactone efflux protein
MPSQHTFIAFTIISLGIAAVPGPSIFFIVSQGALHGRTRALAGVLGIELAGAIRVAATAAGLSALLASSAAALTAIRWGGVAYLAYLGLQSLRPHTDDRPDAATTPAASLSESARKGLMVGLGNVKMAIFFLAFFPQFIHAGHGTALLQTLILGSIFWTIGTAGDLTYALASAAAGHWLRSRPRVRAARTRTEAVSYLALAGWTAIRG